jgi:hypothetical protein
MFLAPLVHFDAIPTGWVNEILKVKNFCGAFVTQQFTLMRGSTKKLSSVSFLCVGGTGLPTLAGWTGGGGGAKISISLFQYNPLTIVRALVN